MQLSRRTVLHGLGVSIGLPLLEAMLPRPLRAADQENIDKPPLRMAFVFVPGGVNVDAWAPTGEGADYELSATLSPLAPVREQVLVLSGLNGRQGESGANGHPLGTAPWLSSAPINEKDRGGYCTDISVDQIAARKIGASTRLPSLELGCDQDATQIHTSNISWRGPASPMGKEASPRAVFTRLFGDPKSDAYQRSILDLVLEDARRLRTKLGGIDRTKLDEYLDSVRAIERRIQIAEQESKDVRPPDIDVPADIPVEFAEHLRLLTDLLVLGFRNDATRVSTFMYNNEPGRRSWPEIGIAEGHHTLAHLDPRTAEGKDKLDKLQRIDQWYVAQFAYLLEKLRATPEGEGTLLDSCLLMYGSGLAWGRLHNRENLPIVLAGGGGGAIEGGRHVRYQSEPLANLFLSLLDRAGVALPRIADSSGRLGGLTA
ncbi:MAG: DUF1552 domain-containing protein [Pirellulaceae bacterium]